MPISAEEIIYKYCGGSLFPQPDYYEGRGNNLRDLNSSILELVYKGIHEEIGAPAAKAFVNMVKDLKNTNAKGFLEELYRLERKEWRYSQPVMKVRAVAGEWQAPQDGAAKILTPNQKPAVRRMAEVLNAFRKSAPVVGHDKGVTERFLADHKSEIEASGLSGSYGGNAS